MNNLLSGLVLCGGKSTRMGKDKSLISYFGKPQRDHLFEILKPFCSEVHLSVPKGLKATQTVIPDHFDLDSPLNGILSAFHYDPEAAWITVPVDMPNIDAKAIKYLLDHRNTHKAATCFLDSEGKNPEPLFTLWENKARPMLFDYFNSGGVSPRDFLIDNDIELLHAPSSKWLININTEEDLRRYLDQSGKNIQGGH
ncbi:MAG TPA: molybdenum cofactor guanylyltransferase [Cyclobacteriaceae bacterium]